mgnify:CR=1 FL=1
MADLVPLPATALRKQCDPACFTFETTESLIEHAGDLGQARAVEAIRFGLAMGHTGYHVFVLGEKDDTPAAMGKRLKALGIAARFQADCGTAKHVFTHQVWNMRLMHFAAQEEREIPGYQWASPDELDALPFPTAMRAAKREAERILRGEDD